MLQPLIFDCPEGALFFALIRVTLNKKEGIIFTFEVIFLSLYLFLILGFFC